MQEILQNLMKPILTPHRIMLLAACCLETLTSGCQHSSQKSAPIWGGIVNPSSACTVIWTNQMIEMSLPPGIYDLSPYQRTENLAPRVMRSVTGDFVAEVKVTGDFDPGNQPTMRGRAAFFGAGLLRWQGSTNYLRLERNE